MDSLSGLQHALGNQHLLSLLNTNRVQFKSRAPSADPLEMEADRAAEIVTQRTHSPQVQSKCSGGDSCRCSKCSGASGHGRIQLSSASGRLQPQKKEEASTKEAETQESAGALTPAGGFLVEDDAGSLRKGQMQKSAFLAQVENIVCTTANAELKAAGRSADECPYILKWLSHYQEESAAHIERALWRYAPEAASAGSAKDYFSIIRRRVRKAVATWVNTGKITGVPPGVSPMPPKSGGASSANADETKPGGKEKEKEGFGTNFLRVLTGDKKVQFKEQPSSVPNQADPEAVRSQLGAGKGMDVRSRSRMESAFGRDFSRVRIHTDSRAEGLSSQLNARAFTVGTDIAFAPGEYCPGTLLGDALLAHELAHVAQQEGNPVSGGSSEATPSLEQDANVSAARAITTHLGSPSRPLLGSGQRALPQLRSGLSLQRCDGDIDPSQIPKLIPYEDVIKDLQKQYQQKEMFLEGQVDPKELASIDANIAEDIQLLRLFGVTLEEGEIYARLKAGKDLRTIRGRIYRSPDTPAFVGQRLKFELLTDYLPPEKNARVEWKWKAKNKEYDFFSLPHGFSFTLDESFWTLALPQDVKEAKGMEVFARIYLSDEKSPAKVIDRSGDKEIEGEVFRTGWIAFQDKLPTTLEIDASSKVVAPNSRVIFKIKDWAPDQPTISIDWDSEGETVNDYFVFQHKFSTVGKKSVKARIYKVERYFGIRKKDLLQEVSTEIEVQDPVTLGNSVLDETRKTGGDLPPLSSMEDSIKASMKEIASHIALGGDRKEYWEDRYKAQDKQLSEIKEKVPDFTKTKGLPADPTTLDPANSYSIPIPAVIVYPAQQGVQPLRTYLTVRKDGAKWSARIIDITGAKVLKFDGDGDTSLAAITDAFMAWKSDNPYPTGGRVVYTYSQPQWSIPNNFSTTTTWKGAKEWVDSILQIGGIIAAGLLLAAPEATITKILGLAILSLAIARSGVAIYENLELGGHVLDKENIIEALAILTAALGMGGGVLRNMGAAVKAVNPAMFRLGNVLIIASVGSDVGTLVYTSEQAYHQLQAVQGDPTLDDAAKSAEFTRVLSSLLLNGLLVIVSNKGLFKGGFAKGDFIKERIGSGDTKISQGTRLELELELKKQGLDPKEIRAKSDREILNDHFRIEQRQKATSDLARMRASLTGGALEEFKRMETEFSRPEDFAEALSKETDLKSFFEKRAAERQKAEADARKKEAEEKKQGKQEDTQEKKTAPGTPVIPPTAKSKHAEQKERLQKLDPASKIEIVSPKAARSGADASTVLEPENQIRINGEIDLHPDRLVELNDADLKKMLVATRELAAKGSFEALDKQHQKVLRELSSSGSYRLRFEYQRKQADALLKTLGVAEKPIFQNMTDFDRNRIYDLITESALPGAPNVPQQATNFAMSKNPRTPSEFVNFYQFYRANFESAVAAKVRAYEQRIEQEMAKWLADNPGATDKSKMTQKSRVVPEVRKSLGIVGDIKEFYRGEQEGLRSMAQQKGVLNQSAANELSIAYDALAKQTSGHLGSGQIDSTLAQDALIQKIKDLPEVNFGGESAAVYHTAKHIKELPLSERTAGTFAEYSASAMKTIKNPTAVTSVASQDGSARLFFFERQVSEGGQSYNMRALVIVSSDGKVVMASYMGSSSR
jgi:hypothetical protein